MEGSVRETRIWKVTALCLWDIVVQGRGKKTQIWNVNTVEDVVLAGDKHDCDGDSVHEKVEKLD